MEVKNPIELDYIEAEDLPLLVLSDNMRSWVSARIKSHEHGSYNHLMWMIRPGFFTTQNMFFKDEPVVKYIGSYRIKLWHNAAWTTLQKAAIISELRKRLKQPWYRRIYDPLQIVGIRLGIRWLQIPGNARICSDHADVLRIADKRYDLKSGASPSDVNRWLTGHPDYQVYGRYAPD